MRHPAESGKQRACVPNDIHNVGNRQTMVGGTDWTATGAGTTGFNGQYGDDGTYGGKTAYKLDATHYLVWVSGSSRWEW